MRKRLPLFWGVIGIVLVIALITVIWLKRQPGTEAPVSDIPSTIELPGPRYEGKTSVEQALLKRRSVRDYGDTPLDLAQVSQLLWAAQGITDPHGFRTAPSAGALYPLELYLVVGAVEGLDAGVYQYIPDGHLLRLVVSGDVRQALAAAALGQSCVRRGAVVLVYAAVYERTTRKYGYRGHQYVHIEAGHAAQNVYLQAVSLDLGTVVVGAFDDDRVKSIVHLPEDHVPLYLMPVGPLAQS